MFGSRKTSKMDSYLFHASQDTRRLVKGLRCCSCLYVFCEKYEVRKRGKFGCCTWSKWYWCEWRWKWWRPSWWWWGWCSWRGWCRYSNARCKACPAYTLVDRKKTALPDKIQKTRKILGKQEKLENWVDFFRKLVKWKLLIDELIRFHEFFSTNFPNLKVKGLAAKMDKMFMSGQVHKYKNLEKIYIYALYSPRSSSQKWCCSPVLIFLSESPLNVTSNRFWHLTEFLKLNCFASFEKLFFRIFTRILVNFKILIFTIFTSNCITLIQPR